MSRCAVKCQEDQVVILNARKKRKRRGKVAFHSTVKISPCPSKPLEEMPTAGQSPKQAIQRVICPNLSVTENERIFTPVIVTQKRCAKKKIRTSLPCIDTLGTEREGRSHLWPVTSQQRLRPQLCPQPSIRLKLHHFWI